MGLYPLSLQGAGTEDIEALPSYVVRLAAAHGVSVHQFLLHLASRAPPEHANAFRTLEVADLPSLVRANTTTEFLVQVLADSHVEQIETLGSATLLPLRHVLNRAAGYFSKQFRWCPACFDEQMRSGDPAYFKLSWLLRDIKACRHHRLQLKERCRKCNKPLNLKSRWLSVAHCCHCEASLFHMTKRDRIVLDPHAAAPDLLLLIADMVATPENVFPPRGVSRYLRGLLDVAANTKQEIDLFRSISYEECWRYASDDEPVTLRTARRLAYYLEVPIYHLLLGGDATSRSFGFAFKHPLPSWMTRPHRLHSPNREWLQSSLSSWLKKSPRSLRYIAKQLGVSVGAMRYQCPNLVATIAARRKQKIKEDRENKQRSAVMMVCTEISHWNLHHRAPISRKALLRAIRQKSTLPKHILRRAIAELLPAEPHLRLGGAEYSDIASASP